MPFDAEGYRKAAKEANISDDVIERTIAEQSSNVKDVATKPNQQDVAVDMFPNLMKQVMEYAPEVIGTYLGYRALTSDTAKNVYKSIKDRTIGSSPEPTRVEPTMDVRKEPTFSPPTNVGPANQLPGTPQELEKALGPEWEAKIAKSEAIRKERQALAQQNARASMGELAAPPAPPPVAGGQPPALAPTAQAPVQPTPVAPYSQERMAGLMAGQEMANPLGGQASAYIEPLKAVEPPTDKLITGTGREVVAGQGPVKKKFAREYATPLDVPKGYVFLPEGQYIDVLRNDLGQQTYTEQFKNRPFPTDYEKAVQSAKDINRELNRPTREELKASGAAMPEPTPGITKKVGPGKKVVVGGIAGSLLTLADVANAATAKEAAQSIGEALLPIGITPSQAGAPVLPPSVLAAQKRQMEEMQKLGSPYRQR